MGNRSLPKARAKGVTIEEVDSGDWGIGGKPLTTQDVHDLQAAGAR